MHTNPDRKKKLSAIALFIVLCAFIPTVREAIFRDLWFDEALTVREFMFLPSLKAVYFAYVIPNNHIIYTILLKLWNELYLSLPFISSRCAPDLYWRLFTVLTSVLLLAVIFSRW
ncbi:MAG: hypothetical protein PHV59_04320, partial [Victivallales bacterium]|nr:hypothetical protein [Victivallales bacterium]